MRAVTRTEARRGELEAAGCECWIGDPDRIGTLRYALDNVTLLLWLLGTASGPPEAVAALHGSRLRMMLEKTIDTTVRGVVYEAAGTVGAEVAGQRRRRGRARPAHERDPVRAARGRPARTGPPGWPPRARRSTGCWPRGARPRRTERRGAAAILGEYLNPDRDHHLSGGRRPWPTTRRTCSSTPQWVEEHLDDDAIRIVEVDENPALYAEAHIPGAIGFDWKKDLQDQVKRDFLGPEAFGELFGSRGISNDHTIVLYGDRNNWFAAYTYWYLKYYGHDDGQARQRPAREVDRRGPADDDRRARRRRRRRSPRRPGDDAIRAKRDEVLASLTATARSSSTSARRRSSRAS